MIKLTKWKEDNPKYRIIFLAFSQTPHSTAKETHYFYKTINLKCEFMSKSNSYTSISMCAIYGSASKGIMQQHSDNSKSAIKFYSK